MGTNQYSASSLEEMEDAPKITPEQAKKTTVKKTTTAKKTTPEQTKKAVVEKKVEQKVEQKVEPKVVTIDPTVVTKFAALTPVTPVTKEPGFFRKILNWWRS
jgi:hypothetical protein